MMTCPLGCEERIMSIESLVRHLGVVEDPRCQGKIEHRLSDILVIAVCAVIACAESWEDIALYGRSKQAWLKSFLALPNGIPSHDTFRRVFMLIDPDAFEGCFTRWVQSWARGVAREVVRVKWWRWTAKPFGARAVAATIMGRCTWSAPGQAVRGWRWANARLMASRTKSSRFRSCLRPCT